MPISDETARKIQALMDKAAEIVKQYPLMSQTDAFLCAQSSMTLTEIIALKERADRLDIKLEAQHKRGMDGWKFLRNLMSYATGEIDKRPK